MKQLTKEQAIAFAKSDVVETWPAEQIVRFQLFQDKLCMEFGIFHKALEIVLNRPVYTHELGTSNYQNIVKEYLGERPAPTLDEIINLIPEDKRILIELT